MKRFCVQILSVFFVTLMILGGAPLISFFGSVSPYGFDLFDNCVAEAAVYSTEGVYNRLLQIKEVYPHGSYFTKSGNKYAYSTGEDCKLSNIPARGGLSTGQKAANVCWDGYSCCGFARYVFYNVFYHSPEGSSYSTKVSIDNAKIGDFVKFYNHYGIFLRADSNYVYVYDSNYTKTPSNLVQWETKISRSEVSQIWQSKEYSKYNDSYGKILQVYFNANGGSISSDTYKLSSNVIYNKSDSTKYVQKWTYNEPKENGLVNHDTFGIYKTGYTFAGWGTSATGGTVFGDRDTTVKPSDMSSDIKNGSCSITLYAQWKPNTVEVSYNANGGSISSDTYKLSSNVLYNKADSTKTVQKWTYNQAKENGLTNHDTFGIYKTGYTFAGWGTKASGGTVFNDRDTTIKPTDLSADVKNKNCKITLYAQWVPNTLKVYYNVNGGTVTSDTYKVTSSLIGHKSSGEKFYQKWTYNAAKENGLYNRSTFGLSKVGYTFAGWGTKASGGTVFDENDSTLIPSTLKSDIKNGNCSLTLYAQWVPNTLKVYYNANGGTVTSDTYKITSSVICHKSSGEKFYQKWFYNVAKENGLCNISSFGLSKVGYKFAGWGTSASGGTVFDAKDETLTPSKICSDIKNGNKSITLYAQWVPNTVKIYYNVNGGAVSSDTYKVVSGVICRQSNGEKAYNEATYNNALKNGLTNASSFGLYRTGYTFAGWSLKTSGSTVYNENDNTIVPTDFAPGIKNGNCTVTMYARWTPNKVTMHFQSAGELFCRTHTFTGTGKLVTASHIERVSNTQLKYNNKTYNVTGNKTAVLTYGVASPRLSINEAGLTLSDHTGSGYVAYRDCDGKWRAYIKDTLGWYTEKQIKAAIAVGEFDGYHIYSQTGTLTETAPQGNIYFYALWVENHTHSYSVTSTNKGSCTSPSYTVYTCSCGDSYQKTGTAPGHNMKQTTQNASCEAKGVSINTCSVCGYSEALEIPALGHNYVLDETVKPTCVAEGKNVYKCSRCKDSYQESIDCVAHKYTEKVISPTCTANGYTVTICEICKDETTGSFVAPKGHSYSIEVIEPTCTEMGYTVYTCTECSEQKHNNFVEPVNHNWSDWMIAELPDCTNPGRNERVCASCYALEGKTVSATGHSIKDTVFAPTCEEEGYTEHSCTQCDYIYSDSFVNALGHSQISHTAKSPTCTATGWDAYVTCSRCDYSTYAEKAKLGHSYKDTVTAPTCTSEGYTTHTCTRCNNTYTDSKVKALGHSYKDTVTAPTCTKEGYTTHTCTRCNNTYTDSKVKALGHSYKDTVTAPTCTKEGYTTHTCTRCNNTYTDSKVKNLGHSYKNTVTVPTCTKEGYTTHICTRCNNTYTDTKVNATGHKWGEWKETLAPTATANGKEERSCTLCKKTESRATDKLSFNVGDLDQNGKITAADARIALRASVGLETLSETQRLSADVDNNSKITAADARLILRASVGLEDLKKYKK